VYVARAPGRLDVMGGIADYSGSLVLQVTGGLRG
jgi:L-arabinokinase